MSTSPMNGRRAGQDPQGMTLIEIDMEPHEYDAFNAKCIAAGLIKPGDDPGIGLRAMVRCFLATQQVKQATSLLTPKTARRMAQLDTVLDLAIGHGVAESFVSAILREIISGESGMILEGWSFEDPAAAKANIRCLAALWANEDRTEEVQSPAGKKSGRKGKEGA